MLNGKAAKTQKGMVINMNNSSIANNVENVSDIKDYALNYESGSCDNLIGGANRVLQALKKALMTQKGTHPIYSSDYGLMTADLIGKDSVLIETKLKERIISTALSIEGVSAVEAVELTQDKDKVLVNLSVVIDYSTYEITGVNLIV